MNCKDDTIAVIYLARGANSDYIHHITNFVNSYKLFTAGWKHKLYVIFKGFLNEEDLYIAQNMFINLEAIYLMLDDNAFDIGAYLASCNFIQERTAIFFNTYTIINGNDWLAKFMINFKQNNFGLVGATGSFENLMISDKTLTSFPNIHIRSNAFMINVENFVEILKDKKQITNKEEAYHVECGALSLSKMILQRGLNIAVVGKNGRSYSPKWWPLSDTYRQGLQNNLLIQDNQTIYYNQADYSLKRQMIISTWGKYFDVEIMKFKCD